MSRAYEDRIPLLQALNTVGTALRLRTCHAHTTVDKLDQFATTKTTTKLTNLGRDTSQQAGEMDLETTYIQDTCEPTVR
jgi:hypothetical protein